MASPGTSMRDMTAHVERSESQILEEEVSRLEVRAGPLRHRHCPTPQTQRATLCSHKPHLPQAENAEMEQKLQLDKRVSFIAAAGTVLDPTTPSRSTQQWASTPTTIEVSSPVQVAEQQTQQTDVFWMTPIIELFAKLTKGGFCVPTDETLAKEAASTVAAAPAITA